MNYIEIRFIDEAREFSIKAKRAHPDNEIWQNICQTQEVAYAIARDKQADMQRETGERLPIRQYCANGNYLEL